nr:hypothetical protein [Tanacetum cinerariifolium]
QAKKSVSLVMEMLLEKELEFALDLSTARWNTSAHTMYEKISKMSSDSLLAGVNIPQSDEDILKHIELIKIYTTLQKNVLDLEDELKRTKTAQQTKIDDKGIKDVGEEEVVKVVTIAKMIIDVVVDAAQVTTVIADIRVSAAETMVTTASTITVESTKTNVEVT